MWGSVVHHIHFAVFCSWNALHSFDFSKYSPRNWTSNCHDNSPWIYFNSESSIYERSPYWSILFHQRDHSANKHISLVSVFRVLMVSGLEDMQRSILRLPTVVLVTIFLSVWLNSLVLFCSQWWLNERERWQTIWSESDILPIQNHEAGNTWLLKLLVFYMMHDFRIQKLINNNMWWMYTTLMCVHAYDCKLSQALHRGSQ